MKSADEEQTKRMKSADEKQTKRTKSAHEEQTKRTKSADDRPSTLHARFLCPAPEKRIRRRTFAN